MKKLINLIALVALGAVGARADIIVSLDSPDQSGAAGALLSFTGTITNTDPDNAVYFNSFTLNLPGDDFLTDGADDFILNVPYPGLSGGANSGDIELFTVSIDNPLIDPLGAKDGTYNLVGGPTGDSQDVLGLVDFSVTTISSGASSPEPASSQ